MYQGYTQIIVEKQDAILVIKFNNPKKKNCVNRVAYDELGRVYREVAKDESVNIVVLTGTGDFYTAGNDLSASAAVTDLDEYIKESNDVFKKMVTAIIDCPQVCIALVNGPCIGIGTTLTALCDMAWCSETAYFATPFTKLGIVPESCSSYLFPLIVGRSKATEMLLFGEQMSAEDAYRYKFVSRVFRPAELDSVIWPKIREFAQIPPGSLKVSKQLLRMHERESVLLALDTECEELNKRFYTEEFMNAVIAFATRKTKSKI